MSSTRKMLPFNSRFVLHWFYSLLWTLLYVMWFFSLLRVQDYWNIVVCVCVCRWGQRLKSCVRSPSIIIYVDEVIVYVDFIHHIKPCWYRILQRVPQIRWSVAIFDTDQNSMWLLNLFQLNIVIGKTE